MQYKIQGSPEQVESLSVHVFENYPQHITGNVLSVLTDTEDDSDCLDFFSMVSAFTKVPVSIDYMTPNLIKFVLL